MVLANRIAYLIFVVSAVVVLMTSCSKKDAKTEDAIDSGATAANSAGSAADENAGPLKVIRFEYDADHLAKEARRVLQTNAEWLKSNPKVHIQLEGHCDERGTAEYNIALGDRRANAAKSYLTKSGIEGSRVSILSFGKERPVDAGHDEEAWAKNRRVVSVIISQ